MAYVPFAPEIGAKYTLTGADGTVATFNDSTDANYVGILSDVTGLDSPDVRESGDVVVAGDGGWQGNNYFGRRPISITGMYPNATSAADRAAKLDKLRQAVNSSMRADGVLSWLNTATGAVQMQTWVRNQQPLRFTGAWAKGFQLLMVSRFAPLFSAAQHTSTTGTSMTLENQGNYAAYPVIQVNGATSGTITITNTTTGAVYKSLSSMTLTSGQNVTIDMLNHTATRNDGVSLNQYVDFVNSTWPALVKGNNAFTLTGAASMQIVWRDMWV